MWGEATGQEPGDLSHVATGRPGEVAWKGSAAYRGATSRDHRRGGALRWFTDPQLFDWSEEEGKVGRHHPFTAPATDDLTPETAKAKAYDLVLNGFEVGGGSIRIHQPDLQHRVFEVLQLSDEEIEEKFGHLLRAFRYGAPPHGGIAMGMDRIVMLMAGKEAIREVTAFPRRIRGRPDDGAPAPVDAAAPRVGLELIPEG